MSVTIKSPQEIELMREAGKILAKVHEQLGKELKPGMSTLEVDRLGEEMIRSFGCEPSFKGYQGYPASICVSINEEVVHGIPRADRIIEEGDIVSLDAGVIYKGYQSDAARTHGVGEISDDAKLLIERTRQSFFEGIKLRPGMTLAIEPMVDLGSAEVVWMDDDWTVVTEDWSLSAHYENTILITDGEPEIFTLTESEIATGRWNQYLGRQTEA